MRHSVSRCSPVVFFLLSLLSMSSQSTSAQSDVLTNHNDNARTGLNAAETLLTHADVNPGQFGKLFSLPVDGYVYAQPLYAANVFFPGQGTHDVVFVATEHNSVYAFDADSNAGPDAGPLWHVNLGPSVPQADVISGDMPPETGITGTPVIDPATGTLYLVAKTKENGLYFQRVHALDVATGREKFGGPAVISALVSGVGDGNDGQGNVPFNPLREHQRGGLALSGGTVYVPWASHGDNGPYHGWVIGFDAHTLRQILTFNDTPNGGLGGIWMAGMAPAVDETGALFLSTGNGTYDASVPGGYEYGDSMIKLDPSAPRVADYFTPFNQGSLDAVDNDLGAGGLLLLPDQPGAHPHLLVGAGKEGRIYLVDRDNMGGYSTSRDAVVQSLPGALGYGSYGTPAFFNGTVYYLGAGDVLKAFTLGSTTATTQNFDAGNGFTGGGITLNGSAALSGTRVRLTNGGGNEAGSVWASNPVNIGQFSTDFQFQLTNPNADGMTFTLQRGGAGALGASGGALGYGGIGNSVCIKFDIYSNANEGANSTGLFVNGQSPFTPSTDLTSSGIDLHSGHVFDVTITYDGQAKALNVTIKDASDHAKVATQSYNIDIAATIGGPAAYAGFTGGTGGLTATQDILNWSYTSTIASGPVSFYGLSSQPTAHAATTFGFPGATPSVSANGTSDGIVWVTQNTNPNPADHGSAYACVLRAYNADNVAQELYNSGQAAGGRDAVGQYVKFSVPTVADGKVFVGTTDSVAVFGLLGPPVPSVAANVAGSVRVMIGGLRYSTATGQYTQIDTLTNTSNVPITGPVTLVLDNLSRTARLAYAYPKTVRALPAGSPYVTVLSYGSLAPAQSVTVPIVYTQGGAYTPRVLAGPGGR